MTTIATEETVLAWHFVGDTLRSGDPIPPDGEWLVHEGGLVLCRDGLHASKRLTDALQYAPGCTICRVECGGGMVNEADKMCCQQRRILWRVEAKDLLRDFARWCAWSVRDTWSPPSVVLDWLRTGDESLQAAAWAAAWDAARDAAQAAAQAAARAAQANQLTAMVESLHEGTYTKWTPEEE